MSSAQSSAASGDLKNLSLEQLGNVEVTTQSKEPTQVWQTPAAVYVITSEDIRRSGVTNVPDALRLAPGVHVARVSGTRNWAVGIRGFGDQFSKYVQVLIDGRSVYTSLFGGTFWSIDNVLIEDVDRIEVIRGPGGTIWGSDAVNGIINIITRPAADTHGWLASGGGGNVDHDTESLRYGTRARGIDYRVSAFGFVRGPEYHQGGQPAYDWSRFGQIGARADWKHGHEEVTVQGDAYLGKFGDAQGLSTLNPPSAYVSYSPFDVSGGNVLGRWRHDVARGGDLYLQGFWSHDYRIGSNFGETRNTFDVDFLQRTPATEHQQFTFGVGVRSSPSHVRQVVAAIGFAPLDKTDNTFSGFLQEEFRLVPNRVAVTVGTKLEHNNYTGFEYQPSARLLWTPTPTATLWASVSRAVRIPDRVDDEIDDYIFAVANPVIFAQVVGNKDLRAERLVSYEGGFRTLLHPKLYVDFAGFHTQYHDLIAQGALVPTPTPVPPLPVGTTLFQLKYTNGIYGNTDGGEIAPDWRVTNWWRMRAAYSYLHVNVMDQNGFTNTVTLTTLHGSSPNSQASFRSQIDLPKKFEFDQTIRYVGGLPAQKVNAYVTGDVRGGIHAVHGFDVSVVGENLFQPHHAEFGIDPGPNVLIKRRVYAKLVWTR